MANKIKVLLIGESWTTHIVETKGFDVFSVDSYDVGTKFILEALSNDEMEFEHLPCHLVDSQFPETLEGLNKYDVILISDVGANTFLLPVKTFLQFQPSVNKLNLIKDYVAEGGALCMIGGYLSFMGIEGKGKYHHTPIEEILPITFQNSDDRMEHPEGIYFEADPNSHEILKGMPKTWPMVFGYNKAMAKDEAEVVVSYEGDPILTLGKYKNGKTVTYASDCAPHWCAMEFCQSEHYKTLWQNIVKWLVEK